MNTGNIGFTATIITTAITTAFAVVAGIVNHILSGNRDRENQQTTASLKYTEQQLKELYGPLAFLIWEGRRTYTDLVEKLREMRGQKRILESIQVGEKNAYTIFPFKNEAEIKLWIFWIEKDAFPRHEKIKKLLMTKTHLIEGEILPESYLKFLDYHNSWKMEHLRCKNSKLNILINQNLASHSNLKMRLFKLLKTLSVNKQTF
ncbi:hypothetical protein [Nostoc sp.]|uniref:hypothetical protein n=1 Tax=Nostoc sp. TaxID=1180 RepID=UPI002FF5E487